MLTELETELIAAIKVSPLANYLREVAVMPDGDGQTLIKRFGGFAPAVYTVAGDVVYQDPAATVTWDVVCIARNARGIAGARHGDAQTVGLYQMLDVLAGYLDGLHTASTIWSAERATFAKGQIWLSNALQAASLRLTAKVLQPGAFDDAALAGLDDFITFHADYDVDPHQPQTEHIKWAAEPPDYTDSRPELTDDVTLPSN